MIYCWRSFMKESTASITFSPISDFVLGGCALIQTIRAKDIHVRWPFWMVNLSAIALIFRFRCGRASELTAPFGAVILLSTRFSEAGGLAVNCTKPSIRRWRFFWMWAPMPPPETFSANLVGSISARLTARWESWTRARHNSLLPANFLQLK